MCNVCFIVLFVVVFMSGCGKRDSELLKESLSQNEQAHPVFPEKNKKAPFFYNNSSFINDETSAIIALKESSEDSDLEIGMVILKELPRGYSEERYAAELFDYWSLGSDNDGQGVLIVIVEETHAVKIEVGYALEHILTDHFCSAYQDNIKYFFASQYFGDMMEHLVEDLVKKYKGVAVELELDDLAYNKLRGDKLFKSMRRYRSGGGGATERDYRLDIDAKRAQQLDGVTDDMLTKYTTSSDPDEVIENYITTMEMGSHYPYYSFLTQAAQMMRIEWAHPPSFCRKAGREYRASGYKLYQKGRLAVARFHNQSLRALFLIRFADGNWKIDRTKSWVYNRARDEGKRRVPDYYDNPFMFAFPDYKYKKSRVIVPDVPLKDDVKERIAALREKVANEPKVARHYFDLADVLFWEPYHITEAVRIVELGLELDPDNIPYRWLAVKMRYCNPAFKGVEPHLLKLMELTPYDFNTYYQAKWFYEYAVIDDAKYAAVEKRRKEAKDQFYDVAKKMASDSSYEELKELINYTTYYSTLNYLYGYLIKYERYREAELCGLRLRDVYREEYVLFNLYYRQRYNYPPFQKKFEDYCTSAFPSGKRRVTITDFLKPPISGAKLENYSDIMKSCGLKEGDVVVAFDGIEVLNDKQYFAAQRASVNARFSVIVWRDDKYHEVELNRSDRRLGSYVKFYYKYY